MIQTLLSLSGVSAAIITSLYAIRQMKQARASIPSLDTFVKNEGGEIIIREDLAALIDAFGSRMAKSVQMSIFQGMGAQAKIDKGLKGAMSQDIIDEKMPLLNLAGEILGFNTKQYISKHPEAIMQLIPMAKGLMGGKNPLAMLQGNSPSQDHRGLGGYG